MTARGPETELCSRCGSAVTIYDDVGEGRKEKLRVRRHMHYSDYLIACDECLKLYARLTDGEIDAAIAHAKAVRNHHSGPNSPGLNFGVSDLPKRLQNQIKLVFAAW